MEGAGEAIATLGVGGGPEAWQAVSMAAQARAPARRLSRTWVDIFDGMSPSTADL